MKKSFVMILFCALISSAAFGCGSDSGSTDESTSTASSSSGLNGSLTIGAVLPLTGSNATIGEDQRRGVELATEEVNATGGVLGKELVVKVEDSEGTPQGTLTAARKLVSVDKVPVVIGEFSSGNTIPMGKYLEQQNVVHLNSSSSSPDIAKVGDFSFSTLGLDNITGKFVAQTLSDNGYSTAAFMAPNNAYGQGLYEATKSALEDAGGQLTDSILYTEGKSDYRAELDRLSGSDADTYIYTGYGTDAATINREAFELNLDPSKFFCIYTTLCTADSDEQAVEGQFGFDNNFIGSGDAGSGYQQAYKDKYGEDFQSSFSGYVYDAVALAGDAMNEADSTDPSVIREEIAQLGSRGYEGVTGEIKFDSDGQRLAQPFLVTTISDGKVDVLAELFEPGSVDGLPGPSQ